MFYDLDNHTARMSSLVHEAFQETLLRMANPCSRIDVREVLQ